MYISLFIILLVAEIIFLIFYKPLLMLVRFNSNDLAVKVIAEWEPLLRIKLDIIDFKPYITVFIFNTRIMTKLIKKTKKANLSNIKAVALKNTGVKIYYGFYEPDFMGYLYGVIGYIGTISNVVELEQYPYFIPDSEYLHIEARTSLNIGITLKNLVQMKIKKNKKENKITMDQTTMTDNVDSLFKSLENFTQNEGIIGKPVVQGNKTFLPVVSITVGYGGGNASIGKGQQSGMGGMTSGSSGTGTGAQGLGAKLCTDAVIVIDNNNESVTMMQMSAGANMMDKIPQIISGMSQNKQAGQSQGQNSSQSQSQSSVPTY